MPYAVTCVQDLMCASFGILTFNLLRVTRSTPEQQPASVDFVMHAAPAYLGCFRSAASDSGGSTVLPQLLSDQLTASNVTEQCWKLAAASHWKMQPLFGVSGSKCFGGESLADATGLGPAPQSACVANKPDVSGIV